MTGPPRSYLPLYLIGGYVLLIAYASLHPLSGWQDSGVDPLAFLSAAWPRYYTVFDLATNTLAYLPLGFLCAAALRQALPAIAACILAASAGALLSLTLETLQNYLPHRYPSNLDLACNAAGAMLGAIAATYWGSATLNATLRRAWREHVASGSAGADLGVLLVGAWLMTQLSPEILLFGTGDLRRMLDLPPVQAFEPERFAGVETAITASGLLAAALVAGMLLRTRARLLVPLLLLLALGVRMLSQALIAGPSAALSWLTPGNAAGVLTGLALWWCASFLAPSLQRAVAALALLLATVMVNAAPENPYLHDAAQVWLSGQFLNFNGLTRLICAMWPYFALPWLMTYRPERSHASRH